MTGEVGILNVAAGDTKLSFDPKNAAEAKRAAGIVEDMVKRGFVILIEIGKDDKGPVYRRAHGFDPETSEYIIAGDPPEQETALVQATPAAPRRTPRGGKASTRRIPAATTNAVAVARTAGG
jgi:hypothetical protein